MATKNDITGDALISRVPSQQYKDNYDAIFRKPKEHNDSDSELDKADNLPEQEATGSS